MPRTLIVGCGYVGGALARQLAAANHELWAVSRGAPEQPLFRPGLMHMAAADVCDRAQLKLALAPALSAPLDHVCYLVAAGQHDESTYRSAYVTGLQNLLELLTAHGKARLFFASSTAVYAQRCLRAALAETEQVRIRTMQLRLVVRLLKSR